MAVGACPKVNPVGGGLRGSYPREILLDGSLVDWSAPMEPWDKVAGSRTVPDVAMVMGQESWRWLPGGE